MTFSQLAVEVPVSWETRTFILLMDLMSFYHRDDVIQ